MPSHPQMKKLLYGLGIRSVYLLFVSGEFWIYGLITPTLSPMASMLLLINFELKTIKKEKNNVCSLLETGIEHIF